MPYAPWVGTPTRLLVCPDFPAASDTVSLRDGSQFFLNGEPGEVCMGSLASLSFLLR